MQSVAAWKPALSELVIKRCPVGLGSCTSLVDDTSTPNPFARSWSRALDGGATMEGYTKTRT